MYYVSSQCQWPGLPVGQHYKVAKSVHCHRLVLERLVKLRLPSMYYWRRRNDVIEMYKHTHGKYTVVAEYIKMDTERDVMNTN